MKRIVLLSVCLLGIAPLAPGQDSGTTAAVPPTREEAEENYKTLKGHVQDMIDAQVQIEKQLQDLAQQVVELREQQSKPAGNFASQDDLKRLADALQEIDKKREADKALILQEIDKLGKAVAAPTSHGSPKPIVSESAPAAGGGDETGYNYVVKSGDTISAIAQAYREQEGVKVSVDQILKANPGLSPAHLRVGQKIFIPGPKPAAKTQ